MIKKGLELYAREVLLKDADLRRFWSDNGLTTNAKGATKLQRTFIEKTMQVHKLIYYAGHILYPEWGINKPIKGKHEGLITLDTAFAIIKKQQLVMGNTNKKQVRSKRMSEEHPLRGVITCACCNRKFTSRNTAKYRVQNGVKVKKLYPYYGCNNPDCSDRANLPKKTLECDFRKVIETVRLPATINPFLQQMYQEYAEEKKSEGSIMERQKRDIITKYKKRQLEIEEMLPRLSNFKLLERLEKEWAELEEKVATEEEEYKGLFNQKERHKAVFTKCTTLLMNPEQLRDTGNPRLRKLLVLLRFGDSLTYSKKE